MVRPVQTFEKYTKKYCFRGNIAYFFLILFKVKVGCIFSDRSMANIPKNIVSSFVLEDMETIVLPSSERSILSCSSLDDPLKLSSNFSKSILSSCTEAEHDPDCCNESFPTLFDYNQKINSSQAPSSPINSSIYSLPEDVEANVEATSAEQDDASLSLSVVEKDDDGELLNGIKLFSFY